MLARCLLFSVPSLPHLRWEWVFAAPRDLRMYSQCSSVNQTWQLFTHSLREMKAAGASLHTTNSERLEERALPIHSIWCSCCKKTYTNTRAHTHTEIWTCTHPQTGTHTQHYNHSPCGLLGCVCRLLYLYVPLWCFLHYFLFSAVFSPHPSFTYSTEERTMQQRP